VLAALQQAPGVLDCSVFGNALHVLVGDAAQALQALPAFLEQRGLRPVRLQRIRPSLEDAFVQLIAVVLAKRRAAA
jgi:ABC-2 type transport system ATP-binding protein